MNNIKDLIKAWWWILLLVYFYMTGLKQLANIILVVITIFYFGTLYGERKDDYEDKQE